MSDRTLTQYGEILRNDFAAFVQRAFPEVKASEPFQYNWHIEVLAEKLEAVRRGEIRRLIINLPPRHLKSVIGSVAFPAFLLGHKPSAEVLCISYAQDLTDDFARSSLSLMRSPFYQATFKTRLSPDRQAVEEFKTTAGGCRRSTSVAGGLTGRGADFIIIDDPIKADDSQSDARRGSVNASFYNSIYSRLNNKETGAIVIIMQRLHADDLVAYVQEREAWDVVAFPAIAERDEVYNVHTPYGSRRIVRKEGVALQPSREPLVSLQELRSRIGEYTFAAQYQQDPQPAAGIIVKREWLHEFDLENPPKFEMKIQSWDTANKATELADYSVCTTWGVKDNRLYLLDVFWKKLEFPELEQAALRLAADFRPAVVLIEDKVSGTSLIQSLRQKGIATQPVSVDGDKIMRLRAQTAKISSGLVLFPRKAPWLDAYLLELTTFPNSKNDDRVDSTVHALAWLDEQYNIPGLGLLRWYEQQAKALQDGDAPDGDTPLVKVIALTAGTFLTMDGRSFNHSDGQIFEVDENTAGQMCRSMCFRRISD